MKNEQILFEKAANVEIQGVGQAFGTFGELLQGVLPGNFNFLVTLPIERYSICHFSVKSNQTSLQIKPNHKKKSLQLARELLLFYGLPTVGEIEIRSELIEGKGLASSTSDMVATARAIEDCYKMEIPVIELESLIRKIEPSDGIMYQGVVSYYHREVKLKDRIGPCPPLSILAVDEGGVVDTVEFNHEIKPFSEAHKKEYQVLLEKITFAIKSGNTSLLGEITTRSAELNQFLQPKCTLEKMKKINKLIGGSGVVTAHSGTYVGIIISKNDPEYKIKIEKGTLELKKNGFDVEVFHSLDESRKKEGLYEKVNA